MSDLKVEGISKEKKGEKEKKTQILQLMVREQNYASL